jgi:hypothetical protein
MAVLPLKKKSMQLRVRFSYLVLFLVFIGGLGFSFFLYEGLYQQHRVDGLAMTSRIIPLPVARMDGKMLFYGQIMTYQDLLPGFDEALEHIVSLTYVELVAEELDVRVSRDEIDAYRNREGGDGIMEQLDWSGRQYESRIVEPLLLAQQTEQEVYSSEKYQEESRDAIDRIERDLELDIPFTDLAFIYSEDFSAPDGGYLDYYAEDDAFLQDLPIFDLELFEPSEVIELDTSFVIAQLYDEVVVDEERVRVGVQWIVIRKQGLSHAMEVKREEYPVQYFIGWE